jgi:chorismate mutase
MTEALKHQRARIDALDDKIIDLLAERMDVVREVGFIKAENNLSLIQSDRVNEVRERCATRGAKKGLNPELVRRIYNEIFDEAHQLEQLIISKSS